MNLIHRWLCRSAGWRRQLENEVVPWVLQDVDLGSDVLEVGPGPGLTTDLLRPRVKHLTAIEIDARQAGDLRDRLQGSNTEVIQGDATAMPFPASRFSGAVCFTMLHHVPSPELQDRLLTEVCRVLKPGGVFVGTDSRQSVRMRLLHINDTLVPVDADQLAGRLERAGFTDIEVQKNARRFRFRARRA